jgi:hypothetical protein
MGPDPAPAAGRPGLLADLRLQGGRDDYTPPFRPRARPGRATCTARPGAMRWSAQLAGPAAPSGSAPGQCARARGSRGEDLYRQTKKGNQGWLTSTPCIAACSRPTRPATPRPWLQWRGKCTASWQRRPPIWARCGPVPGLCGRTTRQRQATSFTRAQTDACAAAASPGGAPPREMSVQMRKLTAAAPVPLGAVEPPVQGARPSGNGQRQVFAASPRLRLGASQPSPTSGPDDGHRCWPRHDNGCLAAAGLTALRMAASLGPDLPGTDDPELFFAESPDDVEMAKALSARSRAAPKGTSRHDQTDHPPHAAGGNHVQPSPAP